MIRRSSLGKSSRFSRCWALASMFIIITVRAGVSMIHWLIQTCIYIYINARHRRLREQWRANNEQSMIDERKIDERTTDFKEAPQETGRDKSQQLVYPCRYGENTVQMLLAFTPTFVENGDWRVNIERDHFSAPSIKCFLSSIRWRFVSKWGMCRHAIVGFSSVLSIRTSTKKRNVESTHFSLLCEQFHWARSWHCLRSIFLSASLFDLHSAPINFCHVARLPAEDDNEGQRRHHHDGRSIWSNELREKDDGGDEALASNAAQVEHWQECEEALFDCHRERLLIEEPWSREQLRWMIKQGEDSVVPKEEKFVNRSKRWSGSCRWDGEKKGLTRSTDRLLVVIEEKETKEIFRTPIEDHLEEFYNDCIDGQDISAFKMIAASGLTPFHRTIVRHTHSGRGGWQEERNGHGVEQQMKNEWHQRIIDDLDRLNESIRKGSFKEHWRRERANLLIDVMSLFLNVEMCMDNSQVCRLKKFVCGRKLDLQRRWYHWWGEIDVQLMIFFIFERPSDGNPWARMSVRDDWMTFHWWWSFYSWEETEREWECWNRWSGFHRSIFWTDADEEFLQRHGDQSRSIVKYRGIIA